MEPIWTETEEATDTGLEAPAMAQSIIAASADVCEKRVRDKTTMRDLQIQPLCSHKKGHHNHAMPFQTMSYK